MKDVAKEMAVKTKDAVEQTVKDVKGAVTPKSDSTAATGASRK